MIDWAEHEFRLERKSEGATERDHLESARRQIANLPGWKGRKADAIVSEQPPFPEDLGYLWGWFCEISPGLSQNGMGYPTVTWDAIQNWSSFMSIELEPWEANALVVLGAIRANVNAEKQEAKSKSKDRKP